MKRLKIFGPAAAAAATAECEVKSGSLYESAFVQPFLKPFSFLSSSSQNFVAIIQHEMSFELDRSIVYPLALLLTVVLFQLVCLLALHVTATVDPSEPPAQSS